MSKSKSILLRVSVRAVLAMGLIVISTLPFGANAATLSVTPSAVSNTYSGVLTLQITGLTNGEQVIIERYLDLDGNGAADSSEPLLDTFRIRDGGVSTIGGITNVNVPYDSNPASGTITTSIGLATSLDSVIGQHLFRLVSPSGNFLPQIATLLITNASLNQSVAGTVFNGVSPISHAVVVAFTLPNNTFVGGVVTDGSGHYVMKLSPGSYAFMPVLPNYYTDQSLLAVVSLTNGTSITTNLFLTNGSLARTLSGRITDATNGNALGGVFLQLESGNLFAIAFTDASGNYSAALTPSLWRVRPEADAIARRAYVTPQNRLQADLTAGSVANADFAFPKADALFYGRITDNSGTPFANIKFFANDDFSGWKASGYSDPGGNYAVAVLAGAHPWNSTVATLDNTVLANYIISTGVGDVTFSVGQTVRQDFIALRATAQITGHIQDNTGNAIVGVNLHAHADIGGISYDTSGDTDEAGNYTLPAGNGSWSVSINCCGNEGLDNYGLYDPPNSHDVSIPPNPAVLDITAYPLGTPFLSQPMRLSSTQLGFVLSGSLGAGYTVQASTNLSSSNWFNLFSLNLTSSSVFLQDNQATNRQRFYRAQKN